MHLAVEELPEAPATVTELVDLSVSKGKPWGLFGWLGELVDEPCDELKVKAEDRVSQENVIALANSTRLATGPHVYFEVRVSGEPKDPMKVVTGGRKIAPDGLAALFQEAADAIWLDPKLIAAAARAKSGFDSKCHSECGAIG